MASDDEKATEFSPKPVYELLKRSCDFIAAFFAIVVFLPLIILIALRVKSYDGGPVFYRANRVGRYGKPFKMLKFRTMVVDAEKMGASSTTKGDSRLTGIGMKLRKYKLDELPQLFNVLAGSMSFVGPRPQVQWAVDRYSAQERLVLEVMPGMTDYASLRFHNEEEILVGSKDPDADYMRLIHPKKMELSLTYVQRRSLFVDLKIMAETIITVLRK